MRGYPSHFQLSELAMQAVVGNREESRDALKSPLRDH